MRFPATPTTCYLLNGMCARVCQVNSIFIMAHYSLILLQKQKRSAVSKDRSSIKLSRHRHLRCYSYVQHTSVSLSVSHPNPHSFLHFLLALARAVGRDVLWKPLNHRVLLLMRDSRKSVRIAALKTLHKLFIEVLTETPFPQLPYFTCHLSRTIGRRYSYFQLNILSISLS